MKITIDICYQSPKKVDDVYDAYLKGVRIITIKTDKTEVKR